MGKKKKGKKTEKAGKKKKQPSVGPVRMEREEAVAVFRALSDENRVKILELLSGGEFCTADLLKEVNVVQSTMSHHMKVLMESSLVSCRKDGKKSFYSIRGDRFKQLGTYLEQWNGEQMDESAGG